VLIGMFGGFYIVPLLALVQNPQRAVATAPASSPATTW
jgi:hypothetical protein